MFRESVAWQKAMELSTAVYALTRSFPKEEIFGLTSQLRRASVSIASNIAEGKGRISQGEFQQFLGIARGSVLEVQTQLELALRLKYGGETEIQAAEELSVEVLRILNASLTTLRNRSEQRKKPH